MSKLPATKAFIFDLDGTLFETDTLLRAIHIRIFDTLREERLYLSPMPPVEKMLSCLGLVVADIWDRMMPDGTTEAKHRADELMAMYEIEHLARGEGNLYPHVVEVLTELKHRGYQLFVASNGLELYVHGVCKYKELTHLFDGIYSAGQYETTSKVDLVARLMQDHQLSYAWMVGDRSSDMIAGRENGLATIGCAYADYGHADEIAHADVLIHDFRELLTL